LPEPKDEFVSFEKALRDLKMQSEELKKLVSEGEIRAFRDGQSMKFKREDIDGLASRRGGDELVFADALEDDTGMVTEELTEAETLLAEDDVVEEAPAAATPRAPAARRPRAVEVDAPQAEPGWVTAAAIVTALVAIWGFAVIYAIAAETPPGGLFTGMFAKG
jgi:excisionase family DNA binding protein